MRIRKSASRILGSAYCAPAPRALDAAAAPTLDLLPPPPPPLPAPCSAPESRGVCDFSSPAAASGELCELNRSPWDLLAELSISNPQVEDELVDRYFVHVATRASWLFSATMPSTSANNKKKKLADAAAGGDSTQLQRQALKKAASVSKWKEGEAKKVTESQSKKKAKVKKEVGQLDGGAPQVRKCKKNDGKSWHCHRTVAQPDTLCDHRHFLQKRCYSDPDFELPSAAESEEMAPVPAAAKASKRSTGHKPRKKKKKKPGSSDFSATEGFYYYSGFGPFRTKRQCRSGGMNEPLPAEQEEKKEQPRDASSPIQAEVDDEGLRGGSNRRTAGHGNASSCDDDTAAIAGVDEVSSDDDFDGLGVSGHAGMNGGDPQATSSGDGGTRTMQWKRWRKPVKARSLMSLMEPTPAKPTTRLPLSPSVSTVFLTSSRPPPASTKITNPSAPRLRSLRLQPLSFVRGMRIRKSASRLLGSAYSGPAPRALDAAAAPTLDLLPPPPPPPPCSAPESRVVCNFSSPAAASGELCELSRSPWDLIAELSLSDPQEEDDLVDKYFVHKKHAAARRDDSTLLQHEPAVKKAPKKAGMNKEEGKAKKKAKVKKEEEGHEDGGAQQVWMCKKNDGKRWHCHRTVSQPNTLCAYHFVQKRAYLNPDFEFPASSVESEAEAVPPVQSADSKPSTSKKPRKKKPSSDFNATEGFYYYAGFGPFRTKRQCRSGGMNEPIPAKQEEEEEDEAPQDDSHHTDQVAEAAEDTNRAAPPHDDVSSYDDSDDIAGIAGVDEESSDEDYDGIGIPGRSMNGQASSGDSKRKNPGKRWRKPVKARSLKSLILLDLNGLETIAAAVEDNNTVSLQWITN
ncbi:hypothetical protein U9M48_009328 [Paspalum notatum var. saurae]|uniref:WRC domain-containing protein n=1 Tax=Paspalum notatum var. saurae TaxID=547442 RepID=A0AAQ3SRF1_PASNO